MKWKTKNKNPITGIDELAISRRFAFLPTQCDDGNTVWLGWTWILWEWPYVTIDPSGSVYLTQGTVGCRLVPVMNRVVTTQGETGTIPSAARAALLALSIQTAPLAAEAVPANYSFMEWEADSGAHKGNSAITQSHGDELLFRNLVDEWYRDRPRGDIRDICTHRAYLRIVAMGPVAIPMILRELERRPGHWFVALSLLTNAKDVVPLESRGKIKEMAAFWIKWGRDRGLI